MQTSASIPANADSAEPLRQLAQSANAKVFLEVKGYDNSFEAFPPAGDSLGGSEQWELYCPGQKVLRYFHDALIEAFNEGKINIVVETPPQSATTKGTLIPEPEPGISPPASPGSLASPASSSLEGGIPEPTDPCRARPLVEASASAGTARQSQDREGDGVRPKAVGEKRLDTRDRGTFKVDPSVKCRAAYILIDDEGFVWMREYKASLWYKFDNVDDWVKGEAEDCRDGDNYRHQAALDLAREWPNHEIKVGTGASTRAQKRCSNSGVAVPSSSDGIPGAVDNRRGCALNSLDVALHATLKGSTMSRGREDQRKALFRDFHDSCERFDPIDLKELHKWLIPHDQYKQVWYSENWEAPKLRKIQNKNSELTSMEAIRRAAAENSFEWMLLHVKGGEYDDHVVAVPIRGEDDKGLFDPADPEGSCNGWYKSVPEHWANVSWYECMMIRKRSATSKKRKKQNQISPVNSKIKKD